MFFFYIDGYRFYDLLGDYARHWLSEVCDVQGIEVEQDLGQLQLQ